MSASAARKNMVDCQIHTNGVVDAAILDAFATIPREIFLPRERQALAYADEDIETADGRFLMAPAVHARLLQAAAIASQDRVLDIGSNTGYGAAVVAALAGPVAALEQDAALLQTAQKNWAALGVRTIVGHHGPHARGLTERAPYNVIVINGAVEAIPDALMEQLAPGGRIAAVIRAAGSRIGQATIVQKAASGHGSGQRRLFECSTRFMAGFEPAATFDF